MEKIGVVLLLKCSKIEILDETMKTCKYCNKHFSKLADSHIIPRAFFEYTKNVSGLKEKETMLSVTNTKGVYPYKRMTIGIYDNKLVCEEHEKIFGVYDDYAIRVLLKRERSHINVLSGNIHVGWSVKNVDFQKLMLFFISVLWRALASDLDVFKRIDCKETLKKSKKLIQSSSYSGDFFSVLIGRFTDTVGLGMMVDPYVQVIDGVRFFKFYPGAGYIFFIKADTKPVPKVFSPFILTNNKPMFILNRGSFLMSKECGVLEKVIAEADNEVINFKKKTS